MADTPIKNAILSEAGRAGMAKRLAGMDGSAISAPATEALRRIREMEVTIDPQRLLSREERRSLAKLAIEIADREQELAELTERVILRQRDELDAKRERFRALSALAAA